MTILGLIAAGAGVTIMPRANKNLSRTGVVYRPLTGSSMTAVVVAAYRADQSSLALEAFLDALVKAAHGLT